MTAIAPVRVSVPARTIRNDYAAVRVVWQRDIIRYFQDHARIAAAVVQPVLFLFVLGTGLSRMSPDGLGGLPVRTFFFPGVLALSTLFTAFFSAGSVVWDREFGFLREMLVAPVSRTAIVLGKCLGGATVATVQGCLILAMAGGAGVPYHPLLLLSLVGQLFLLSFVITAFGLVAASRIKQMQSFMAIVQMVVMPMFFLSGALYPLGNLPSWLQTVTLLNPLTYAVDPMRRTVASYVPHAGDTTGITWAGWELPIMVELVVLLGFGLVLLGISVAAFRKSD